jgi:DNA-binding MarR family transcriptional regulator
MNLFEMVLMAVAEADGACVSELAEKLQLPAAVVASVLDKLEADGLLNPT